MLALQSDVNPLEMYEKDNYSHPRSTTHHKQFTQTYENICGNGGFVLVVLNSKALLGSKSSSALTIDLVQLMIVRNGKYPLTSFYDHLKKLEQVNNKQCHINLGLTIDSLEFRIRGKIKL